MTQQKKSRSSPTLYVIAGPNGSGKTTFVRKFLPFYAHCLNFVNADLIASGLAPFSPEVAAIKAGKLMLQEIEKYRKQHADFAFETTLAGKTYVRLFQEMKARGYKIHLYFLWLRNSKIALARVAERVSMGGHDIPAKTILRRFDRGLYNLFHLYRPLLDSWVLFDNSGEEPNIVANEIDGIMTVVDDTLFQVIRKDAEVL